jgi:hypothetical protein
MMENLLDEADVRIAYDSRGNKREVLIDYDKFQTMIEFIERYAYFYSQEVQERLEKSNEDVLAGRYLEVNAVDVEHALEWLNE